MKPYMQVALFFAITQLLGIYTGVILTNAKATNPELQEMSVVPQIGNPNDPLSAIATSLLLIGYIILGAIMVILAARFFKGMLFFRLLEFFVVSSASSIVFFALAFALLGVDIAIAIFLGIVLGFLLGVAKFFWTEVKNSAAIISSAGVGALFGFSVITSFGPLLGFLAMSGFIVLLSLYDYIAVFKTKHMITMARELSTRQLSFAVTAKSLPKRMPSEPEPAYVQRATREGERLDLGTGDLSVPAMISVSAYSLGPNGLLYALAVGIGSTLSLYFLLRFVSLKRVFLPALPPICLGGMLALLLVKLAGL